MKRNIQRVPFWLLTVSLAAVLTMVGPSASAQTGWSQSNACPGWNNPTNFTQGMSGNIAQDTYKGWRGRLGDKSCTVPNAATGATGIDWQATDIAAGAMATTMMTTGGDCALFPGTNMNARAFTILDSNTTCSGHPANRDPNTGDLLPYVPTHFNTYDTTGLTINTNLAKTVRVGDACGRTSGSPNAEALYYYMYVEPKNAMMFLYYACVIEAPYAASGHGTNQDPAFMIRVTTKNSAGEWVQASPTGYYPSGSVCDTLAYFITSTPYGTGSGQSPTGIQNGVNGWHYYASSYGTGYSNPEHVWWKEWSKVSLNLSSLMYSNVRIEVMVSDCCMTQHFSYAYICGECRPMTINSSGCPAGMSTDVTTLAAPRGLDNYVWKASEYGVSATTSLGLPDSDPNSTAYFTFRQLTDDIGTEADSAYLYHVQAEDFNVTYRPNAAHQQGIPASPDSVGNRQTFCCTMTSAINPAKPFDANLYVNVQNTKPTMDIDSLSKCGGDVVLHNRSYVPGDMDRVNLPATTWSFYHNPLCLGQADTVITGDTAAINFTTSEMQGVKVRTNTHQVNPDDPECYSEAIYPIRPLQKPVGGYIISQDVLCDDDPTTLTDTTPGSTYRIWMFRDTAANSSMELTDSLIGVGDNHRSVTRPFSHAIEPIDMLVRNGNFYLNPQNTSDTIWCENIIRDTVSVFLHPELQVVGDTIVCQGTLTDATVSAIGVENCTYQWSTSLNSITGNIPSGNHLAVVPYADTSTYYVRVTSPQGCVAWDSIHAYLVSPRLTMLPADGRVCPGDTVTLIGSNANSYTWSASPTDVSLTGQEDQMVVNVVPRQNTTYTLVGHGGTGDNICDASPLTTQVTIYPYPVPQVHLNPGIIDSENPVSTLRDDSPYSETSSWVFSGGETVAGREVTHTFEEATGADSVYVTLINANELGCETVYPFAIPVNLYTAWFPNIFTPGSEDQNSTFRLFTINAYEFFHIYIYNRRGELVFDSDDPEFVWDGTMDGKPCPQGTYVYVCRFRKPGTNNLAQLHGSVTLVR